MTPTCPADGQMLIKVPLARVQVLGCPRCRGVWVGKEQLMSLALEQAKAAAPVSNEVSATPPGKTAHRYCTVQCQTPLTPKIVRGIEIDRCTTCDGYWFDGGEVQRLLKAYKPPSLKAVGSRLIHEVRNRGKAPTAYQSKWRQSIADASLDGAAELVVEVVLESLNSAEW